MRIKKVLVLLLILLCISSINAYGKDNPYFKGEIKECSSKGLISYSAEIKDNPGICGYHIYLAYDTSVFSVQTVGATNEVEVSQGNFSNKGFSIASKTDSGCQVFWYNTENVSSDGTLFTVYFSVKENAEIKEYPIVLSYSAQDTVNVSGEKVNFTCDNGCIKLREFAPTFYFEEKDIHFTENIVSIPVCVRDNPGLAGCKLFIGYDTKYFEPVLNNGTFDIVLTEGFTSGSIYASKTETGCQVLWFNSTNIAADGEMFTLKLRALKPWMDIQSIVSLNCSPENAVDENGNIVSFNTESETIIKQSLNYSLIVDKIISVGSIKYLIKTNLAFDNPNTSMKLIVAAYDKNNGKQLNVSVKSVTTSELSNGTDILLQKNSSSEMEILLMLVDEKYLPVCKGVSDYI